MNYSSEIHKTNAARMVEDTPLRIASERRLITIQPNRKSRLVFLTDPEGLAAEQYRLLRRRLCTLRQGGGVVLITSPSPAEGKTLTSVNLAWCLADGGDQTCLVDLDFRAPGVASALGYAIEEDGVEDILSGTRTIAQSIREIGPRPLYVLGVRRCLASPTKLFAAESLAPLLNNLRAMFQWVILDFAPIIPMSDVAEVVPQVDGALMIVRAGKTEKTLLPPALEALGTKLWGVVVNDSPINGSSYYGHYGNRKE